MKLSDPAAAGDGAGTVELGGQTYLVPQAGPADMMAVRRHLKKHVKGPLQMYADLLKDPDFRRLPRKVREEVAKDAAGLRMRGEVALTVELAAEMLQEPEHCAFLAWVLIRKAHPDVTLERLRGLVTGDNAAEVFAELHEAAGLDSLGN